MKIRFIINPIAGVGKQKKIEILIEKYFSNYDIFYTKMPGDATMLCKKAVVDEIDVVIAVGGDGTINECIKSIINTNTSLGIIPCGSGNGFAYHIGMNKSIKKSINQLKNCSIQNIDTCSVNNLNFINVSGVGFDAHIANLFLKLKNRGLINYLKLIIKEIRYQAKKYNIKYNNTERNIEAYMISFANASQYGNNAKIASKASITDGLIDFIIVKKFPKWQIPIFIFKLINGSLQNSNFIEIIKEKKMQIISENSLIHLDGEPVKVQNPIKIKVIPKSLKILMPNEKK